MPSVPSQEKSQKNSLKNKIKRYAKIGLVSALGLSTSGSPAEYDNAEIKKAHEWKTNEIRVGTHKLLSYNEWQTSDKGEKYASTLREIIADAEKYKNSLISQVADLIDPDIENHPRIKEEIADIEGKIVKCKEDLKDPTMASYLDYVKTYVPAYNEIDKQKEWLKKIISSPEYRERLEGEYGNPGSAREELAKRLENIEKTDYEFTEGWTSEGAAGKWDPSAGRITIGTANAKDGSTGIHEYTHASTYGNKGISELAKTLYGMAFDGSRLELEDDPAYLSRITEQDARKKEFEHDLEKLGVKKYGEIFTDEHYKKILELQKEGKLGMGSEEFLRTTKPKFIGPIMNIIADASQSERQDESGIS